MYEPIKSEVNNFLDKTKRERENRRLEGIKLKSVITIQRWYRGYKCRSTLFAYTRNEFTNLIKEEEAVEVINLGRAIKCLRFKFLPTEDKKNFHLLSRQLILSIDSPRSSTSFISLLLKKDSIPEWIRTSNWILKTSLEYLGKIDPVSQQDSKFMIILLTLSLNLLTSTRWKVVVNMKNPNLQIQMTKITDTVYLRLMKSNLYPSLKELLLKGLCKQNIQLSQISLNGIMSLILKIFSNNQPISDANMLAFINHVLSVPALVKHMNIMLNDIFQSILRDRICTKIILFLHKDTNNQIKAFANLQASYSLCIIANIIDLGLLEMDVLANHGSEFCTVLSSLLVRLNRSITQTISSSSHYHHIFGWSGVYMDENIQSSIVYLRGQLRLLWSSKMIRSMFDELYDQPILDRTNDNVQTKFHSLSPSATSVGTQSNKSIPSNKSSSSSFHTPLFKLPRLTTSSNFWKKLHLPNMKHNSGQSSNTSTSGSVLGSGMSTISAIPISIQSVCMLYFFTTSSLTQIRDDILAGVSLTDLPARMWRLIKSSGSVKQWASVIRVPESGWYSEPHPTHLLHIFVLIAINLFIILDDVELFDKEKVFMVTEVLEIADFFNKLFVEVVQSMSNDQEMSQLMSTNTSATTSTTTTSLPTNNTALQTRSDLCRRSSVDLSTLYGSCHKLLMILHERDIRHPYTAPGFWLYKNIKPSHFMNDLSKDRFIPKFLLKHVPHIIPHKERIVLFRERIKLEKSNLGLICRNWNHDDSPIGAVISVRRSRIVEDGYEQLMKINADDWKKKIRVRFINELGMDEVGIDLDGVFKEFLEETIRSLLNPSLGLFCTTSEQRLYPSPLSGLYEPNHLLLFQYLGRMMAKALYEGLLVEAPFAHFFLTQLLRKEQSGLYSFLDELATFDKELYRSLTYVKHFDGDISDLELTFSYDEDRMGCIETHDLRPGGRYMTVTNDTRISYVHMVARFRMFVQIRDQVRAFISGFYSLIHRDWLDIFSVPELLKLICGDTNTVDIDDLKNNVKYSGGFHSGHKVIQWLWDVLKHEFTEPERGLFLKFVTSCSKPPLLGFSYLNPPFSVRCVHSSEEEYDTHPTPEVTSTGPGGASVAADESITSILRNLFTPHNSSSNSQRRTTKRSSHDPSQQRLPSAATCFNLLKLPNYDSKSILRDKLRYVIHSGAGFELS